VADFNTAWAYTAQNEGEDSSYEQYTRWGVTVGFLKHYKLGTATVDYIKTLNRESAGSIIKKSIWKLIRGELITNQHVANLLLDAGFNKPAYTIEWACKIYGIPHQYHVDNFFLPQEIINKINAKPQQFYISFWWRWWNYILNSGHFLIGAAGLSKRAYRYVKYGEVGKFDNNYGALAGWQDCKNKKVLSYLETFLKKKGIQLVKKTEPKPTPKPKQSNSSLIIVVGGLIVVGGGFITYKYFKK
jgi:hypothetical protein